MTLAYTILALAALLTLVSAAALIGAWRAWREVEKQMDEVEALMERCVRLTARARSEDPLPTELSVKAWSHAVRRAMTGEEPEG